MIYRLSNSTVVLVLLCSLGCQADLIPHESAQPVGGTTTESTEQVSPSANSATKLSDGGKGIVALDLDSSKKWAILIGVKDYQHMQSLHYCDRDMQQLGDVLTQCGGHLPENVVHVGGQNSSPTRKTIIDTLETFFRQVEPGDKLVFAFSGHGTVRNGAGYLVPADGDPESPATTCVPIALVHDYLRKTKEVTKIVIIDACHSGSAKGAKSPTPADFLGSEGTYELLSCGALQESWEDRDLDGGHGVFSHFLAQGLLGLADLRSNGGNGDECVTFDEAYKYVHSQVPDYTLAKFKRKQIPYRRSDGAGEQILTRYDPTKLPLPTYADLITLPGLNGDWYMTETPWLAPFVRRGLGPVSMSSNVVTTFKPDSPILAKTKPLLDPYRRRVHENLLSRLDQFAKEKSFKFKRVVEQIKTLSRTNLTADEQSALINDMKTEVDPHTLAVFMYLFGMTEAGAEFENADKWYTETKKTQSPEYALFLADYARYLSREGNNSKAASLYVLARQVVPNSSVAPLFHIACWVRQADTYRKTGPWSKALECLLEAEAIAKSEIVAIHPYTAYVQERKGWAFMDVWRLNEAEVAFRQACEIRETLATQASEGTDLDNERSLLHDQHGLAMNQRYLGRSDLAVKEYSSLILRAKKSLRSLRIDGSPQAGLYASRLANSYFRLGDCHLYSPGGDLTRAAENFGKARELYQSVPVHLRGVDEGSSICKQAMALALDGNPEKADLVLTALDQLNDTNLPEHKRLEVEPLHSVAKGLINLAQGDSDQGCQALRAVILEVTSESGANLNRDDWDMLLLASTQLIQEGIKSGAKYDTLHDDVVALFRVIPEHFVTQETLPYLRPRFHSGINAILQSHQKPTRRMFSWLMLTLLCQSDFSPTQNEDIWVVYPNSSEEFQIFHWPHLGECQLFKMSRSDDEPSTPPASVSELLGDRKRPTTVICLIEDRKAASEFLRSLPSNSRVLP